MTDALVVGAGPAGLSAAIALRGAGAEVIVLEQHPSPPPRVCGAFINPEGTGHLEALGVMRRLLDIGAVPVTEARVTWPGRGDARVPIVRGDRAGLAVPRPALEQVMAEHLATLGGAVQWGARASRVDRQMDGWSVELVSGVVRRSLTAPCLVVADGRFSSLSGRQTRKSRVGWFGWNAPFTGIDQPPGALSLHFGRDGYVGLLTFGDGVTNVCGLTRSDGTSPLRWEEILAVAVSEQVALAHLLRSATRVEGFRGVGPLPFSRAMWPGPGPLLAGDAAAVGDPYMGEGISRALGTGPALSAAMALGGPGAPPHAMVDRYNKVWQGRYQPRLWLGTAARWLFDRPRLAAPLLGQIVSRPSLLRIVLSVAHGPLRTIPGSPDRRSPARRIT
jgi:menaquinone-9 beta-reductase